MTFSKVVLPEPFGPISPTISPCLHARLTPSSAFTPPNASATSSTAQQRRSRGRILSARGAQYGGGGGCRRSRERGAAMPSEQKQPQPFECADQSVGSQDQHRQSHGAVRDHVIIFENPKPFAQVHDQASRPRWRQRSGCGRRSRSWSGRSPSARDRDSPATRRGSRAPSVRRRRRHRRRSEQRRRTAARRCSSPATRQLRGFPASDDRPAREARASPDRRAGSRRRRCPTRTTGPSGDRQLSKPGSSIARNAGEAIGAAGHVAPLDGEQQHDEPDAERGKGEIMLLQFEHRRGDDHGQQAPGRQSIAETSSGTESRTGWPGFR